MWHIFCISFSHSAIMKQTREKKKKLVDKTHLINSEKKNADHVASRSHCLSGKQFLI